MKLSGHPVHPLLIHFPTALLPMELLFRVLQRIYDSEPYGIAAYYCLLVAVLTGLLAIVTGILDIFDVAKTNKRAMSTALYHGFLNGVIILVYGIILYKLWERFPVMETPVMGAIILRAVLVLLLFGGNYLGGALIYKYHVGINKRDSNAGN